MECSRLLSIVNDYARAPARDTGVVEARGSFRHFRDDALGDVGTKHVPEPVPAHRFRKRRVATPYDKDFLLANVWGKRLPCPMKSIEDTDNI